MKSLLDTLSDRDLLALCCIISLIPFMHRDFAESLSPIGLVALGLMFFALGCVALLPHLNTKFKYLITALLEQRRIVVWMVVWLLLIAVSVIVTDTGYLDFARTLAAFLMGWLVFVVSRSKKSNMMIVRALGISALIVIIFAVFEFLDIQPISSWLNTFNRNDPFVDIKRISSVLNHPNYMAAYLEVTLPFVLIWMLATRHQIVRVILGALLVIGLIVFVLSFSRGGMLSFIIVLIAFGILAFHMQHRLFALASFAMVGIIILTVIVQVLIMPRARVRYFSEGSNDIWYRAVYSVQESVQAEPGQTLQLSVDITNTGLFEWETEGLQPVNLGYHIICWDENTPSSLDGIDMSSLNYLVAEGPRTSLPRNVAPGETVTLNVSLNAPAKPGYYVIAWDMIQESVTWFSKKGLVPATTALDVSGEVISSICGTQAYGQDTKPDQPSRLSMWWVALQTIRDNPLLGIGAGNFDTYYVKYTGVDVHPTHTHNSYLTFVVDYGILAGLFVALALFSLVRTLIIAKSSLTDKRDWYVWFGSCVALTSLGIHSLINSFNYQTSIFLAVATIIGLVARFATETDN